MHPLFIAYVSPKCVCQSPQAEEWGLSSSKFARLRLWEALVDAPIVEHQVKYTVLPSLAW
jgi:hypothetical protein